MITLALKLAVLLSVLLPCEAELLFVGDAMAHGPQLRAALQPDGTYDFTPCFDALRTEISGADYAVVNLETPVSGGNYSGYPMFNAPDSYVDALRDAGFDLFLTANNHTLDRGDAGLKKNYPPPRLTRPRPFRHIRKCNRTQPAPSHDSGSQRLQSRDAELHLRY